MPKGPNGQKRPGDVIGTAIMVAKIATVEIEENSASEGKQQGGKRGGAARAVSLTPQQRSKIASLAAQARWKKV